MQSTNPILAKILWMYMCRMVTRSTKTAYASVAARQPAGATPERQKLTKIETVARPCRSSASQTHCVAGFDVFLLFSNQFHLFPVCSRARLAGLSALMAEDGGWRVSAGLLVYRALPEVSGHPTDIRQASGFLVSLFPVDFVCFPRQPPL